MSLVVSPFLFSRPPFVFKFHHFDYDVSRGGLFGFILTGTLCASWTCVTCSLTKLGKFSVIPFSDRFSLPCSFSFPFGILMIQISCFILFCSSLKLHNFLTLFVLFYLCMFVSSLYSNLLFLSSASSRLLEFLLVYSSLQILHSSFPPYS